jgi:hypothetical protein
MHNPRHGASPENTSEFVKTHCATCAAGWTRATEAGEMLVVCLLDRQPVWAAMSHCSRYEPEELTPPRSDLPPGPPRGK